MRGPEFKNRLSIVIVHEEIFFFFFVSYFQNISRMVENILITILLIHSISVYYKAFILRLRADTILIEIRPQTKRNKVENLNLFKL